MGGRWREGLTHVFRYHVKNEVLDGVTKLFTHFRLVALLPEFEMPYNPILPFQRDYPVPAEVVSLSRGANTTLLDNQIGWRKDFLLLGNRMGIGKIPFLL